MPRKTIRRGKRVQRKTRRRRSRAGALPPGNGPRANMLNNNNNQGVPPPNGIAPPNEQLPELHQLVEDGNLEGVDDYLQGLEKPPDVLNLADGIENMSPLMRAASNRNLEMVHLLLSYGADPNFIDGAGGNETALMYAIATPNGITMDSAAIVEALLHNANREDINFAFQPVNADPNIPNVTGHTALDAITNLIELNNPDPIMVSIQEQIVAAGGVSGEQ